MADISPASRLAVYQRDNYQCQACGTCLLSGWKSVQHRKARGVGGGNGLENLVLLCGSAVTGCHGICESRDCGMRERGFWVNSWDDPAVIPIVRWDSTVLLLLPDGMVKFSGDDVQGDVQRLAVGADLDRGIDISARCLDDGC